MAFELYGLLAGSVSPMTGETIKPAYGGEDEAFLKKVVTPIYDTIAKVCFLLALRILKFPVSLLFRWFCLLLLLSLRTGS